MVGPVSAMGRNLVICADGTGNAYVGSPSNAARIVDMLAMGDEKHQVVAYDQGIGTDSTSWRELKERQSTDAALKPLRVLPGPHESWFAPARYGSLVRGLVWGAGLRENVQQMYEWLAEQHPNECDRLYLFGFSRGAFTVRVLAGLLFRCGLPAARHTPPAGDFDEAWTLYKSMRIDDHEKRQFWQRQGFERRKCRVTFLGLWDTVKSYGGLRPVLLPHLRHNPIVGTVCHALALDERRGWFDATSWGWTDHDRGLDAEPGSTDYAAARLDRHTIASLSRQKVTEVWFTGSHSDVGGGGCSVATSNIALTWMLAEAAIAGIALSPRGEQRLRDCAEDGAPQPTDWHGWGWRLSECLPRRAIENEHQWPTTKARVFGPAERCPRKVLRGGLVALHTSARVLAGDASIRRVATRWQEALAVAKESGP